MKQKTCRAPIAIWWEACTFSFGNEKPLIPVKVIVFTPKTVTILEEWESTPWQSAGKREKRHERQAVDRSYFPTFEEAKAWLVSRAVRNIESHNRKLALAKEDLRAYVALQEPPSADVPAADQRSVERMVGNMRGRG
jgi:hypothetical protein